MVDLVRGKYKIVREIARSNDIVYEAVDVSLGRHIALKMLNIPPNLTGTAHRERVERFSREARAAGRLSHPNIVSVYEYGEEVGSYFIAMEYLEGQTLRDLLQSKGSLSVQLAIDIGAQILDALAYAHSKNVIHRDIKPDNIHILPNGQVKLTDFGIARLTEEPSLTSDGQVFGTPSYMSPEQIEGKGIDTRSDLFSAGIVLYEMFTGRKPFTGDSVVSITYAIMNSDPPPFPGISPAIESVVRRSLAKQPSLRPQSAAHMRLDLIAALQSNPALPINNPPPIQTGSFSTGYFNQQGSAVHNGTVNHQNNTGRPSIQQIALPPAWQAGNNGVPQPGIPSGVQVPFTPNPAFPLQRRTPPPEIPDWMKKLFLYGFGSIVIGTLVAVAAILFVNRYEAFQQSSQLQKVSIMISQAEKLYNSQNYAGAAKIFTQALNAPSDDALKSKINTELAYSYVHLAHEAERSGDSNQAISYYNAAINSEHDYGAAHAGLASLYQSLGQTQQAQEEDTLSVQSSDQSQTPASLDLNTPSFSPPAAGGSQSGNSSSQFFQDQEQKAAQYIQQAQQLMQNGDSLGAEQDLEKAVAAGAGMPEGDQAQTLLDQLHAQQNDGIGSSSGSGN